MESILNSTKKTLNIPADYDAFDVDVLTHLNAAFSVLTQVMTGLTQPLVEDDTKTWDELELPLDQLNLVRSYIYLKVRLAFDPPQTGFHVEALKEQIREHEGRLLIMSDPAPVVEEVEAT